jgi:hypothetical protein
MSYLLAQYWTFIVLALVLGLYVGWVASTESRAGRAWSALGALAFAGGCALAWLEVVPGLPGHILEVALLLLGGYFAGCLLGSLATPPGAGDRSETA